MTSTIALGREFHAALRDAYKADGYPYPMPLAYPWNDIGRDEQAVFGVAAEAARSADAEDAARSAYDTWATGMQYVSRFATQTAVVETAWNKAVTAIREKAS